VKDTIAAISTPRGFGGIGIVRLSGNEALTIAQKIFSKKIAKPRYALYGAVFDPTTKAQIDTAVVTYYKAPHSYTGEDIVEISMHGGIKNLEMVLNLLISLGARMAERGEFTRRAVLNGKMDIFEANAVVELIEAKTEKAVLLSSKRLFGGLSEEVANIRSRILTVNSQIEASIDFPFDVEEVDKNTVKDTLETIVNDIKKLLSSYKESRVVFDGVRVAIVGKPNVGKSTLLNALLKFDRAIVSEIPGTTRDTVEETIDFYGIPMKIIDTAGIRDSNDTLEKLGIERSKRAIEASDLILFVFDASTPLDNTDFELLDFTSGKQRIVIVNKTDLPKAFSEEKLKKVIKGEKVIEISALLKEGIDKVEDEIKNRLINIDFDSVFVTNKVEFDILNNALSHIAAGLELLQTGTLDLVTEELRDAIEILGSVSGEALSSEILDTIFSRFCIGK
jgi:tRNA modification GTPase